MEPRIVKLSEIRVIGVPYYGKNDAGQIPAMWPVFDALVDQIENKTDPPVYLGVEAYTEEFSSLGKWFYLAGIQVTKMDSIPVQLVGKILPANGYAVFTHRGRLSMGRPYCS